MKKTKNSKKFIKFKKTKQEKKRKKICSTKNSKKCSKNCKSGGRMSIPSNTGTDGSVTVLVNDIYAVVGSVVNTFIDTADFIGDIVSFKSDMGSQFNDAGAPGAQQ